MDVGRRDGRDIKPANVFIDKYQLFKLGDFGLARILSSDTQLAKTNVGTPYYMAPEQVNELPYNEKCDIWSMGCLLFEMAALVSASRAHGACLMCCAVQLQLRGDCRWELGGRG
jgi:serine/threonine protein kinase